MKKIVIGALMFSWGLLGVLVFTILAALHPVDYNGITGLHGALLAMGIMKTYVIFVILAITGLLVCVYAAFFDDLKLSRKSH